MDSTIFTNPAPVVVFLHSGSYDRILQGTTIAATATHSDRRCEIYFFFWALEKLIRGRLDDPDLYGVPLEFANGFLAQLEQSPHPSPSELLKAARETGRCTIIACSASMNLLGLSPEDTAPHVDRIVGWPTILRSTSGVIDRFYL